MKLPDELEELIERNIGFIIIEPVVAAGGVYAHSPKIFELLRIAQTKGIIVIFDETVTGFGKLGPLFAKDYFNFEPDISIIYSSIKRLFQFYSQYFFCDCEQELFSKIALMLANIFQQSL